MMSFLSFGKPTQANLHYHYRGKHIQRKRNRYTIKIVGLLVVLVTFLYVANLNLLVFQQHRQNMVGNTSNMKKRLNYNLKHDPTRIGFDKFPHYNYYSVNSTMKNTTLTTIVVQFRGEMGNHLSQIAHGRGIQLWAIENFGIESHLLFLPQTFPAFDGKEPRESPKGLPSRQAITNCFFKDDSWDFENHLLLATTEFMNAQNQQQEILSSKHSLFSAKQVKHLGYINGRSRISAQNNLDPFVIYPMDLKQAFDAFLQLRQHRQESTSRNAASTNADRISIPFLYSDSLDNLLFVDRYYDHFRNELFSYDFDSCCNPLVAPYPDETVFHYRNFGTELKSPETSRGLQEASPNQTASVLFKDLERGSRIAITSRFNNEHLQAQVDALTERGFKVRVITGQSGIEDFCFLLKANQELVGNFQSTYAFWAAILGQSHKVKFYTINSKALQKRYGSPMLIQAKLLYNFTNPKLRNRIEVQLIDEEKV